MKSLLFGASLALMLVACGTQVVDFPEDDGTGASDAGGFGATGGSGGDDACEDVKCRPGFECVDGECESVPCKESGLCPDPCDDVDCPEGEVCVGGECTPVDPCEDVCCEDDEVCEDGQCVPKDPCEDVDCCEDEVCIEGECVPEDPCDDVVCPEGKECHNGYCVCDGEEGDWCGNNKTKVCHFPPGNWENKHNVCVSNSAVPAHLSHGDKMGDCNEYN